MAKLLAQKEGIFCGGSAGTNLFAALSIAENLTSDDIIVFVVPDTGERYLSKFHNDQWLKEKRLYFPEVITALDILENKSKKSGSKLYYLSKSDKIKTAIGLLNKTGFSQLPVLEEKNSIGSLMESKLLSVVLENPAILDYEVASVMTESFPVIQKSTELNQIKELLKKSGAVLISENDNIVDIITQYDLIEFL